MIPSNLYNPNNITQQDSENTKLVMDNLNPEYSTLETITAHLGNAIDLSTPALLYRELKNNPGNPLARQILVDDGMFTDEEFNEMTAGTLSEEDWKKSPHYREGLKYKSHYTEQIAQNLAEVYDRKQKRAEVISGSGVVSNVLGFVSSVPLMALDPINRIPITRVSGAAKYLPKNLAGRMVEGAIEAGVGTAITLGMESAVDSQEQTLKEGGLAMLYGAGIGSMFPFAGAAFSKILGGTKTKYKGLREKLTPTEKEVIPTEKPAKMTEADIALHEAKEEFHVQSKEDKAVDTARFKIAMDDIMDGKQPDFSKSGLKKSNEIYIGDRQVSLPKEIDATGLGNKGIHVEYEIRELKDLIASHQFDKSWPNTLKENASYPQELQPRDRSRLASVQQINSMAEDISPNRLIFSAHDGDGAPIINSNGIVESGNGRVIALNKAYDIQKSQQYLEALKNYGFDVKDYERPVLVRVRKTELNSKELQQFVKGANESTAARMSETERAITDANSISDDMLARYEGGSFDNVNNAELRQSFRKLIPTSELGEYVNKNGELSRAGLKRMEAGIMYKAYEDVGLIERLFEDIADFEMKTVQNVMKENAPYVAKLKAKIARGQTESVADFSKNLIEAFNAVYNEKKGGSSVKMFFESGRLFDSIDPRTEMIARSFFKDEHNFKTFMSKDKMSGMFKEFTKRAENFERIDNPLFPIEPTTKEHLLEVFDQVRRDYKENVMPSTEVKSWSANKQVADEIADSIEKSVKSKSTIKIPDVEPNSFRLYRGLEQEFDANYNLIATDAPSGYSTWTDNPELARQYAGKDGYVYYIDLPKEKIGKTAINENPKSEFYGDRELVFDNEKAAGLNDVTGKEFLVYTEHDEYNHDLVKLYEGKKEPIKEGLTTETKKVEPEFEPRTPEEKVIHDEYKQVNEKIDKVKESTDDFINCIFSS